jgi:hypothetical protein
VKIVADLHQLGEEQAETIDLSRILQGVSVVFDEALK